MGVFELPIFETSAKTRNFILGIRGHGHVTRLRTFVKALSVNFAAVGTGMDYIATATLAVVSFHLLAIHIFPTQIIMRDNVLLRHPRTLGHTNVQQCYPQNQVFDHRFHSAEFEVCEDDEQLAKIGLRTNNSCKRTTWARPS